MLKSKLIIFIIILVSVSACSNPKVLDHFKCYVAEGKVPEHELLRLKDQFHVEEGVKLVKLRYFCNPVTKSINDKPHQAARDEDHLTCYKIVTTKPFHTDVTIRNQFGDAKFKTKDSELLCVPTLKRKFKRTEVVIIPPVIPDCPGGKNCCCNMSDGAGGTWPDCNPGFECRREANPSNPSNAIQVCVRVGTPIVAPLQLNPSQPPFCRR